MKSLNIICNNKELDLVGYNVYQYLLDNYSFDELDYDNELCKVLYIEYESNDYYFMITSDHVMHNFSKYLPFLKEYFSDVDVAIHINYHTGATAPDPILSVHHVGDISSGTYLPFNPQFATNLIVNMERLRCEANLEKFTSESETTHFSGVIDGNDPKQLLEWNVNNIDLEIGSLEQSMNNKEAVALISKTIFEVFNDTNDKRLHLIYCGGAHFEQTYTNAVLNKEYPIYLSHQLCGIWLLYEGWEQRLKDDLRLLIDSSTIKCDGLIFHQKVKKIKPILEELSQEYGIPVFKYNALKNIENSELINLYK